MPVTAAADHLAALYRLKRAGAAGRGAGAGAPSERPKPDALDLGFDAVRFALDTWARWKTEVEGPQIAFVTRALARASGAAGGRRLVVDLGDVARGATGHRHFRVENPGRAPRRVLIEPLVPRTIAGVTFGGQIALARLDGADPHDLVIDGERTALFEVRATPTASETLGDFVASAAVFVGEREAGTLTLALRVTA